MDETKLSAGSPCQPPKTLYVEVAGTDVEVGHQLVLEKDGGVVKTLSMSAKKQHQLYECDYTVDDAERRDYTLSLTIDKKSGGTIRLPLLDAPQATQRSARIQPNLLFPVYPLAKLPHVADETHHASLRAGYLYVFWNGILWRELHNDENGQFRDIDLASWREQAKNGTKDELDERAASGKAIDTVWVPARFQGIASAHWTVQNVEMAWSEEQWSWDYIESLESGRDTGELPSYYGDLTGIPSWGKKAALEISTATRRKARCENLSGLKSYDYPERFGPESMASHRWRPVHTVSLSRKRDPGREFYATNPFAVTSALDGSGLSNESDSVLHRLQHELEQLEGHTCKTSEVVDFAKGMANWVGDTLDAAGQGKKTDGASGLFSEKAPDETEQARQALLQSVRAHLKASDAEKDRFVAIRERNIAAVTLPDPLFELGWLTQQASLELNHLSTLVESTQRHPHFKSAMMLHSAVFDHRSYRPGPFDKYRHTVDSDKLDAALRSSDRKASRERLYDLIEKRVQLLERPNTRAVFNDLFALNGVRSLIGQATLNQCLTHLDTSIFTIDKLAGKATRQRDVLKDEQGSRYIEKLASADAELSAFVTVDPETVPMDRPLAEKFEDVVNDGSGRPRPALLQRLQNMKIAPADVPDALQDMYHLSRQERQQVVDTITDMGDATLSQWSRASYTTLGQLIAELTSQFYGMTQRTLLRKISSGSVYKHMGSLQVPARLMKLGNPFLKGLTITHASALMVNPNPDMVVIGLRFGNQTSGVGQYADDAINDALKSGGNGGLLRPQGGVPYRVGPGMEGNYALIKDQHGRLLANATSVAGHGGEVPKITFQAELFTAEKNSIAARYSEGLRSRLANAAMRWAPPGMLALFGWNTVVSAGSLSASYARKDLEKVVKDSASILYGLSNLMYWLGRITEAENEVRDTKLSWLTEPRRDVEKITNRHLQKLARVLFTDQFLSIAKYAGVVGGGLEVILALWNGVERLRVNDRDAAAGYFTAAGGFFVYLFSNAAGTSLVPLLGITFAVALGILGIVVALAALTWAILCTDDTLETWIKQGPFGKAETVSEYAHLKEVPEDAFQFLMGALFPIHGASHGLSYYVDRMLLSKREEQWVQEKQVIFAEVIEIRSAAFALMDHPKEQFKAWFWKDNYSRRNKQKTIKPDFVHYDADAQALRFYFPKLEYHYWGRDLRRESLCAKVKLSVSNGAILPVSALDEPLKSPAEKPTFRGLTPRWLTV